MNLSSSYLDYAASAPLKEEVLEAMQPWFTAGVGANPSAVNKAGRKARIAVEDARDEIAESLGIHPLEVIFTSGATEANNIAIFGSIPVNSGVREGHVVSTSVEHPSVTEPLKELERSYNVPVTYVPAGLLGDKNSVGITQAQDMLDAVRDDTRLITSALISSELGVIQPCEQWLGQLSNESLWSHIDATQALGKVDVKPVAQNATSVALSAHKVGGPQGVGILILKRAKEPVAPILGGGQERGVRSGTIPIALSVGAAKAISMAQRTYAEKTAHLRTLQDHFRAGIKDTSWTLTVEHDKQHPAFVHVYKEKTDTEMTLMDLDREAVFASGGSACQSGAVKESALVEMISMPKTAATLRFSFGVETTMEDINRAISALKSI